MQKIGLLKKRRERRKMSVRKKMFGTAILPRISVYRSNKYIYAQVINDDEGKTLASASSLKLKGSLKKENCEKVGEELAKKMKELKIKSAVFDRNGFIYTGRIKALADSIRKNGIKI